MKGLTIIFAAPYSPMTNPIETFFHQLKTEYRSIPSRPETEEDLIKKVEIVLTKFRGIDLSGHFRAVFELFDCIMKKSDL